MKKYQILLCLIATGSLIISFILFQSNGNQNPETRGEQIAGEGSPTLEIQWMHGDLQETGGLQEAWDFPESANVLTAIPFIQKRPDFGGEACVSMVLQGLGKDADQDFVFDQSGVDPMLGRGCVTRELVDAIQRIGFRTGESWYHFTPEQRPAAVARDWEMIVDDISRGVPSVACLSRDGVEGFVLVTI